MLAGCQSIMPTERAESAGLFHKEGLSYSVDKTPANHDKGIVGEVLVRWNPQGDNSSKDGVTMWAITPTGPTLFAGLKVTAFDTPAGTQLETLRFGKWPEDGQYQFIVRGARPEDFLLYDNLSMDDVLKWKAATGH